MPVNCNWKIEEVKSSGVFAKVRREFLMVTLDEFSDYHTYIGIRGLRRALGLLSVLDSGAGLPEEVGVGTTQRQR